MGAYLQKPVTEKFTEEAENEFLKVASSKMQGWRINQEDAHNSLLNFDENTAFFAVYDGHGGAEVAEYCSQKLPAFLKETEAFKNGNIEKALKDTFIGFDQTLLKEEVIEDLKVLAKRSDLGPGEIEEESDDDEEDIRGLCQEAAMPLQDVLEKYKDSKANPRIEGLKAGSSSKPLSPCLKGKKNSNQPEDCAGGSSSAAGSSSSGLSKHTVADDTVSSSSSKPAETKDSQESSEPSSTSSGLGSSVADTNSTEKTELDSTTPEKEEKSEKIEESSTSSTNISNEATTKLLNGDVSASASKSSEDQISSSSVMENGEVSSNSKSTDSGAGGSSSAAAAGSSSSTTTSSGELGMRPAKINSIISSSKAIAMDQDDSSDESDEADVTYEKNEADLDEGETTDDVEESEDEGCVDFEDDQEESEDDSDCLTEEDEEFMSNMADEPGKDSGCTAVAAVLKGKQLWVANAGDSRCIVCRNGKVVEMSFDHKPEDEIEFNRIKNAGGRVSNDGRVNGGLNLSRAIGDHGYKMNITLPPEEQMISALPDIKQLTLEEGDEFMVLACDGIWNFMSNEEVVEFVKERIDEGKMSLAKICEELFDNCLAPNTMGDGTGCDNMTAIIIQFKPALIASLSTDSKAEEEIQPQTTEVNTTNGASNKRQNEEVGESAEAECVPTKRQKIDDDNETPAVDTSSA